MFKRGGRIAPSTRRALFVLPIWLLCSIFMWTWWISDERVNYLPLYVLLTLALIYEFLVLPTVFIYFVLKAKKPPKRIAPKAKKVAVISLCVPSSESIEIVEKQLKAMSEITYPHDSWILDEGNDPEIKKLAKKYGVIHFSRKGKEKYNMPEPPFKAKTKSGNVNAWLDFVKRRNYEYFVQLDIDHLPKPNYLHKTLGYFRDDQVAWVQAPSVYKNLDNWTALGAAEQELVLQGPLQMGFYGHSDTPFIIGSHCTYRMSAIREIGGFQPTRAEDHLDTVVLSNRGYRGVFLPEVIAEGDGPETLNTYLAQQFAWAYSMFQVLLHYSPKLLKNMPWKRKILFLFAQTWYPLWSLSYLIMFLTPIAALLIGKDVASMNSGDFLLHFGPIFITSFLIWWAARPIMNPSNVGLSWRGMILHVVRWPIVLRAILSATFNIKKPYMITPKGSFAQLAPTFKTYELFFGLGLLSAMSVLIGVQLHGESTPYSQIVFALLNASLMAFVCIVDLDLRLRQAKVKIRDTSWQWLKPVGGVSLLLAITSLAFVTSPITTNTVYGFVGEPQSNIEVVIPKSITQMNTDELIDYISTAKNSEFKQPSQGIGIYDPHKTFTAKDGKINHIFADWNDSDTIIREVAKNTQNNDTLLITLEPVESVSGEVLLKNISLGKHDSELEPIAKSIAASNKDIYIRFAHEMELGKLYSWGNQNPSDYIQAYQYVVDHFKNSDASNAKWVWSPAGNNGAEAYYPGDDYVDVIGTTVLYDKYWYGERYVPFDYLATKRTWLAMYNKPLWIVEFGVGNANKEIQDRIIREGIEQYETYGFSALIYLNIADSNIKGPDYRVQPFNILDLKNDNSTNKTVDVQNEQTSQENILINSNKSLERKNSTLNMISKNPSNNN